MNDKPATWTPRSPRDLLVAELARLQYELDGSLQDIKDSEADRDKVIEQLQADVGSRASEFIAVIDQHEKQAADYQSRIHEYESLLDSLDDD